HLWRRVCHRRHDSQLRWAGCRAPRSTRLRWLGCRGAGPLWRPAHRSRREGDEAHVTLLKALGLLGLGRDRVVRVPADSQGRMHASALPPLSGPTIVCLQAGNVNTGALDPTREIIVKAHEAGAWVHVDGTPGPRRERGQAHPMGRAGLSGTRGAACGDEPRIRRAVARAECQDNGLAFVRNPQHLRAALAARAASQADTGQRETGQSPPDPPRRARGVEVWAALRSLGRSGLADLIERCCQYAARFGEGLRGAGYEILNDVVLNQVLVHFGGDEATRRVIASVQAEGTLWAGPTV